MAKKTIKKKTAAKAVKKVKKPAASKPAEPAEDKPLTAAQKKAAEKKRLADQERMRNLDKDNEKKRIKAEADELKRLDREADDALAEDKKHPMYGKYKVYEPEIRTHPEHNFTIDVTHEGNVYRFGVEAKPRRPQEVQKLLDDRFDHHRRQQEGTKILRHGTS